MKFIKSVIEEMKKTSWPTMKQLRSDSLTVIEMTVGFAIIFAIMDLVFSKGLGLFL
ncbi:MAG: preprotein translocase subunit SecE [Lactobacillales bacterium]|jgi:preprotein translocase subunit SecE|nr:preprotein translocase subunit SecE [Lactobacillales bacterium]